jgi:hypothetical protein
MNQRPLVYYWKAHLSDGTILNQYNKYYKGRSFYEIEQDKLIKFGLYPFDNELARKVTEVGTEARAIPFLPTYEMEFSKDKKLISHREVYIQSEEYHICSACNKEFRLTTDISRTKSKYSSPICPNCGEYDHFFCKKCDKRYTFEQTSHGLCPSCKNHLERRKITSGQHTREKRWIDYVIGYQMNINGRNYQFKLVIDEYGNCTVTS